MSADTGTPAIAPPAGIAEAEWKSRLELAAAFRMAYHFGWNDGINNHITARIPGMPEHFLMNPRGLSWQEVTASSLVRLGFDGSVHSPTGLKPGPAGVNFHGAILKAKPELACVIHTHTLAGVVVSARTAVCSSSIRAAACSPARSAITHSRGSPINPTRGRASSRISATGKL
jgi:ribulose-5-phosphate 4-epimerase/fuculose-1-phosphate aldolase